MRIFESITEAEPHGASAIALGFFDGLHLGHQAVIGRALRRRAEGLLPGVFTFTIERGRPQKKPENCEILTDQQKYKMLDAMGVDTVLSPDFSEIMALTPESFVDRILVGCFDARVVCCGEDFRFGARAAAGVTELRQLCKARGIEVDVLGEVLSGGQRISSSWIRALLRRGEVDKARALLGRAFGYDFTVVHGKQLGRTIDSPTINQPMPPNFVQLRFGVYASITFAGGKWLPSVTNIGVRPSVEDDHRVNSETYIYGFSGDLYGQNVEVRLLSFLRPEQKFPSIDALKERIQADAHASVPIAEQYLAEEMR